MDTKLSHPWALSTGSVKNLFIYLFFPWGDGEGNLKKNSLRNSLQLQHCVRTQPAKLWLQSDIHISSEEPANTGSDEHTDLKQSLIKRMV